MSTTTLRIKLTQSFFDHAYATPKNPARPRSANFEFDVAAKHAGFSLRSAILTAHPIMGGKNHDIIADVPFTTTQRGIGWEETWHNTLPLSAGEYEILSSETTI
jgi:hypothetical protein